jgi:hypothetical protein
MHRWPLHPDFEEVTQYQKKQAVRIVLGPRHAFMAFCLGLFIGFLIGAYCMMTSVPAPTTRQGVHRD